jgi:hypothetical protein
MKHQFLCEIQPSHIGKKFAQLPGCRTLRGWGWGKIEPTDVGKRLYLIDGETIWLESADQRDQRILEKKND